MPAAEILALGISIPDAVKEVRLNRRGPVTNALAEGISQAIGGGRDKR
jgi:hypothetical protein